jgi:large subunit ribosomal protein L3
VGRRIHEPRRGSHGFYPRVRASSLIPRIRTWPEVIGPPRLLGFPVYKVGMGYVIKTETYQMSPYHGRDVAKPVTFLEAPPIFIAGIRVYEENNGALKSLTEIYAEKLPDKLFRLISKRKRTTNIDEKIKELYENISKIKEIRVIAVTQPYKTTIGKKTPELLEIGVNGGNSVKEQLDFVKNLLGKEINIKDVFSDGQLVDVIGVTKGKGFQGVIKRFGVKELIKWHKHRKGSRKVGAISPQHPSMMRTIPRPGQMGFHRRTEYNKRIIEIGNDPSKINPSSGFKHYGIIKNNYVIIEGSTPGPAKRILMLRYPVRAKPSLLQIPQKVVQIVGG